MGSRDGADGVSRLQRKPSPAAPGQADRGGGERCLACGSTEIERLSDFGAGDMTLQLRCMACRTIFEAIKWI